MKRHIIFAICVLALPAFGQHIMEAVESNPSDGAIVALTFNDGSRTFQRARDWTGRGNSALPGGSATWAGTNGMTRADGGYRLQSGGELKITDNASLALTNVTVALWVNFVAVQASGLLGQSNGSGNVPKWYFFYYSDRLQYHVGSVTGTEWSHETSAWAPTVGRWYHVALVIEGTTQTFYRNGVSVGSDTTTRPIPQSTGDITIGKDVQGLNDINGFVDEWHLWNRALSAVELKSLYVKGKSRQ